VINGSLGVAPHVRAAVQRAVDDLGYVPNLAARSMVTQRTDSYALIVSESANRTFSDDMYFRGVIRGVAQQLEEADKQLVLMTAGSGPSHDRVERYACSGHVEGIMFFSIHGVDPIPDRLARRGIPVVCNGRPLAPTAVPYVDVENEAGARSAVRHLIDAGRRRIATIAGPTDMVAGIDRLRGYQAELREHGLPDLVEAGDFTRESGFVAMGRLLAAEPDLDAVFAASDLMADGALSALRRAGRRVPDDIAVVGFDDMQIAQFTEPPLTTVRQPVAGIGRMLARHVLRLAARQPVEAALILPTELVVRESG
jgi:DNA-binding LacI/PurR family transcriptional regulator